MEESSPSTPPRYLPPPDVPQRPSTSDVVNAATEVVEKHLKRIINKSGLRTEEQKAMVAEVVVAKAMEVVEQAEWWGRLKRERAEEAARDFKRRRYALLDYVESLKQGRYYRRRPYWWADYFVDDDDDDDMALEIYV